MNNMLFAYFFKKKKQVHLGSFFLGQARRQHLASFLKG
jgi:hypothetical protein